MSESMLLIGENEATYDLLRLASMSFPVRIVHTKDCEPSMMLARNLQPSVIFIEATERLSHNGWVIARLMKFDPQLLSIPIVVISDADNAMKLAQYSMVYRHLPRKMSLPFTQNIIRDCLQRTFVSYQN